MTIEQKLGICAAVAGASWLLPMLWTWLQGVMKKIETVKPDSPVKPVETTGGGVIPAKPIVPVPVEDPLIRVEGIASEVSDTDLVKQVLGLILDARDIAILLGEDGCCEHLDAAAASIFTWEDKGDVK